MTPQAFKTIASQLLDVAVHALYPLSHKYCFITHIIRSSLTLIRKAKVKRKKKMHLSIFLIQTLINDNKRTNVLLRYCHLLIKYA